MDTWAPWQSLEGGVSILFQGGQVVKSRQVCVSLPISPLVPAGLFRDLPECSCHFVETHNSAAPQARNVRQVLRSTSSLNLKRL